MKLQRTTWILLSLALVLGGFVYFYEIQGKSQREAIQAKQKQIFDFPEEEIQELIVEKSQRTLKFERTDDDKNPWQMKQPEDVPASDAAVSFLLNLLVQGKSNRSFTISSNQLDRYGLNSPLATVKILLKNQKTHKLILGKPDFEDKFLYGQVDPPTKPQQDLEIVLLPKNFQYAVEREFKEWKQKQENTQTSPSKTKLDTNPQEKE